MAIKGPRKCIAKTGYGTSGFPRHPQGISQHVGISQQRATRSDGGPPLGTLTAVLNGPNTKGTASAGAHTTTTHTLGWACKGHARPNPQGNWPLQTRWRSIFSLAKAKASLTAAPRPPPCVPTRDPLYKVRATLWQTAWPLLPSASQWSSRENNVLAFHTLVLKGPSIANPDLKRPSLRDHLLYLKPGYEQRDRATTLHGQSDLRCSKEPSKKHHPYPLPKPHSETIRIP